MVERRPIIPENVRTLYEKHRGKETIPTCTEYQGLLESLANEYSEVYIVIDALDECIEDSGQLIWSELLSELKGSLPNLRLLYTSRNIHDTAGIFTESTVIPIRASEADIRTYIKWKF